MGVYLGSDPISLYLGGQGKEAEDINPELTEQETLIQNIQEALVGKTYGANATPETILKGYSAYVHQELVEGTLEAGVNIQVGTGKINEGEFTLTSNTAIANHSINHGLGVIPLMFIIYDTTLRRSTDSTDWALIVAIITSYEESTAGKFAGGGASSYSSTISSVTVKNITMDTEKITLGYITESMTNRTGYYVAGKTYKWIALA